MITAFAVALPLACCLVPCFVFVASSSHPSQIGDFLPYESLKSQEIQHPPVAGVGGLRTDVVTYQKPRWEGV